MLGLLMAKALRSLCEELRDVGRDFKVPSFAVMSPFAGQAETTVSCCSDISYADDVCIPVVSSESGELVATVATVCEITIRVLRQHGLSLNFSAGKTEVVIAFSGFGPKEITRHLFGAKP